MIATSAPVYLILGALCLFAALVVVRYTFDLVRHTRRLTRKVARANRRLQDAAADVTQEVEEAQARLEAIRARKSRRARH